jgi:site-specific DNA-methyltransferase (adenine-specific)
MNIQNIRIADIQIEDHPRKNVGDLAALAKCIETEGLLKPVGVTPDSQLIWGLRTLLACRDILGWETIPANVIDVPSIAHGRFIESAYSKELAASEMVALIDAVRGFTHGGDRRSDQARNSGVVSTEEACRRLGWSDDTYYRARSVVDAATPELIEAMDAKVVSVHQASELVNEPPEIVAECLRRLPSATASERRAVKKAVKRIKREKEHNQSTNLTTDQKVGNVEVWCGDSLTLMRERMTPQSVDVAVTSVPYNVGKEYGTYHDNRPEAEYLDWLAECFETIHGVLKDDGSFLLNIDSPNSSPWRALKVAEIAGRFFCLQNRIVWAKSITVDGVSHGQFSPNGSDRYLDHTWEFVFHLTKTGKQKIDRLAIGVPYTDKGNLKRNGATCDLRCAGDVWFIPHPTIRDRSERGFHPCPFPVELAERCIKLHGIKENMVVLDPFNGSGNSTEAMARLGVDGIGIEIDPVYCEFAIERLSRLADNRLIKELSIHIWDADDLGLPMTASRVLAGWSELEGVPFEAAERLVPLLPEEVRRLLISDITPAA